MPVWVRRKLAVVLLSLLGVPCFAPAAGAQEAVTESPIPALEERVRELEARLQEAEAAIQALRQQLEQVAGSQVSVTAVYDQVRPSVVGLIVQYVEFPGLTGYRRGTGVIYWRSADGSSVQVLTNRHVVEGARGILVFLDDGRVYEGELWAQDADLDWAVVLVRGANLPPPVRWGDSRQLSIGDPVVVIGNPLGYRNSVSVGIVSGLGRSINNSGYSFIQTDAAVNPGNSGGPLLNRNGEMVGLVTTKVSGLDVEGLAFAISTEALMQARAINQRPSQSRAYFGVVVAENLAASAGANIDAGLEVVALDPRGPLYAAGVRAGDEILAINGQRVRTLVDMRQLVDTLTPWEAGFTVTVRRGPSLLEGQGVVHGVRMTETKPVLRYMTRPLYDWEGAF